MVLGFVVVWCSAAGFLEVLQISKSLEIPICGRLRQFAAVLRAICGGFAVKSGRGFCHIFLHFFFRELKLAKKHEKLEHVQGDVSFKGLPDDLQLSFT